MSLVDFLLPNYDKMQKKRQDVTAGCSECFFRVIGGFMQGVKDLAPLKRIFKKIYKYQNDKQVQNLKYQQHIPVQEKIFMS